MHYDNQLLVNSVDLDVGEQRRILGYSIPMKCLIWSKQWLDYTLMN